MRKSIGFRPDFAFGDLIYADQIDPVINCICQSMRTDKIFLLGTYPAFPQSFGLEYDLLVLIDPGYKKPTHEFESLISNRCHDLAMVTASVYKTDVINLLLKQGNIFFSTLCNEGKLIFDGGRVLLSKDDSANNLIKPEGLENDFGNLFSKARSFFSGALGYKVTGDHQLAAFMLHQTVEQSLNSFLTPLIGYRLQTHNLNKLFLYARRLSQRFYTLFPRNSDLEIQLYQTLQRAYIYGRYKNNFQIGKETLQILFERVTELLELTQILFYEKLEEFTNRRRLHI